MITGDLARQAERLVADREPFVHATVVRALRPASVRPGDTALVLSDGTIKGFVGGTCAQTSVRLYAARALETDEALLRLIPGADPDDEPTPEEGIIVAHNPCLSGGSLDILLEPRLPAPRVVIVGETPNAVALEEVARAAGYDVLRTMGPDVHPGPDDAALVVASHGEDEELALVRALEAGVPYVGLVASPRRGAAVRASLDVPDALRERVHAPAGLDLGARRPADVAITILAQLIAERTAAWPGASDAPAGPGRAVAPAATAIDPICGMEVVATDASILLDVDGERVYFCREGCRDTYAAQRAADAGR